MAIVFSDHTINGKILNAFNNSVVRFESDSPVEILNAEITITSDSSYTFEITPSPEGKFYFNFKGVMQKLINASRFHDSCPYPVGTMWEDVNAYLDVNVEYRINYEDLSFDTASFSYTFLKGLNQVPERNYFESRGQLFPLLRMAGGETYLTFFKGFPFSIPFYGENISVTIVTYEADQANRSSNAVVNFTHKKEVARLILSNGVDVWDQITSNEHGININGSYINLKIVERCGVFLKWHNQYGGWNYWLFDNNYLSDTKESLIGSIANDFSNLPDTVSPEVSMGKSTSKSMQLFANNVEMDQVEMLLGIIESPKVLFYLGEKDSGSNEWVEVAISKKTAQYKSRGHKATLSVNVTIPTFNLSL